MNPCATCIWASFFVFLAILVPFLSVWTEVEFRDRVLAFNEAGAAGVMACKCSANDVIGENLATLEQCAAHTGPSHIASDEISGTVGDAAFGVELDKALKIQRYTEYCQWQESSVDRCEKCTRSKTKDGKTYQETYDCNCVREFVYVKGWRNHRINSLLFDQPAAHHNPQV